MTQQSSPPVDLGSTEGLGAWQPIATAPHDGSWVLLTGGEIDYGWCEDAKPPMVVAQRAGDYWQFAWYDSGYYGEYKRPTHWMPLPAPPVSA